MWKVLRWHLNAPARKRCVLFCLQVIGQHSSHDSTQGQGVKKCSPAMCWEGEKLVQGKAHLLAESREEGEGPPVAQTVCHLFRLL